MELGIGMFGDNHYDLQGKPMDSGERLRELIKEIKLMNVLGEVVFQSTPNTNQLTINGNQFSNGVYFVEIKTEKGVVNKKIIKQ